MCSLSTGRDFILYLKGYLVSELVLTVFAVLVGFIYRYCSNNFSLNFRVSVFVLSSGDTNMPILFWAKRESSSTMRYHRTTSYCTSLHCGGAPHALFMALLSRAPPFVVLTLYCFLIGPSRPTGILSYIFLQVIHMYAVFPLFNWLFWCQYISWHMVYVRVYWVILIFYFLF